MVCKTVWFVWEHPYNRLLAEFSMFRGINKNETKNRSRLEETSVCYVDTLKAAKQGSDIDRMHCRKKSL